LYEFLNKNFNGIHQFVWFSDETHKFNVYQ